MHIRALFRFLAHSLTPFGRWGCGERSDHSRCDADPFFFFAQEASSVCGAQGSCYMPDGEGLEGFGDNSPPPNLMGVTGGNMSPISTCRTEPGPSVIGTRQGQTPRLRGVCVCTAPSHRPRHHTLPELRTRHSTANISALHTQLVQQLLRCPL